MVLGLSPPAGPALAALRPLLPKFLGYVLSFLYLGIYWTNHHHLFQVVTRVDGPVLWANLHLLFWLSLVPLATAWLGQSGLHAWPVAIYGLFLLLAAVAYNLMTAALLRLHDPDSPLARALGRDFKGKLSIALYVAALVAAFFWPAGACALYVVVAIIWLIPDRRIENILAT